MENNIDKLLENLRDQINRFKEYGVDKCFVPSIYVHTYEISKIITSIDSTKFNEKQKILAGQLDNEIFAQFQRLSNGRCSCKISKDI